MGQTRCRVPKVMSSSLRSILELPCPVRKLIPIDPVRTTQDSDFLGQNNFLNHPSPLPERSSSKITPETFSHNAPLLVVVLKPPPQFSVHGVHHLTISMSVCREASQELKGWGCVFRCLSQPTKVSLLLRYICPIEVIWNDRSW